MGFVNMEFIHYQTLMLNAIGYTFRPRESFLRRAYALTSYGCMAVLMVPQMHFVLAHADNLPLATNALCPVFTFVQTVLRFTQINYRLTHFYELWNRVVLMYQMGLKNSADQTIIRKAYESSVAISMLYIITGLQTACAYIFTPMLKAGYEWQTTGNCEWTLPFETKLLYDITVPLYYILSYLWFSASSIILICGLIGLDTFFYSATFMLAGHCRIIQNRLARPVRRQTNRTEYLRLRKLIIYHQTVLNLSQDLVDLFRPMLINQILFSSMHICVIAYQLTLSYPLVDTMRFLSFLAALLFQCFVYCNGGSQLAVDSRTISDAIYSYRWYEADYSTQQLLQFFMMRSQKPIVFRAGIFEANLPTFSSMISTAGSYITLLQTMMNKD